MAGWNEEEVVQKIIMRSTEIDLVPLKGDVSKILPPGINLDEVLDAYKKFLALKVCCLIWPITQLKANMFGIQNFPGNLP